MVEGVYFIVYQVFNNNKIYSRLGRYFIYNFIVITVIVSTLIYSFVSDLNSNEKFSPEIFVEIRRN